MASKRAIRLPVQRRTRPGAAGPALSGGDSSRRELLVGAVRWIDIQRQQPDVIHQLGQEFGFHELALDDTLSRIQRPKLDDYETYVFLVMHFPVHNKATRRTMPAEVDFFIGHDFVITVHDGSLKPLIRLFDRLNGANPESLAAIGPSSGRLLYEIIHDLVDYCFPIVNKVGENIDAVEQMIFTEPTFSTVREISILRRDIIALRRIIRPQIGILGLLERRRFAFLGEGIEDYFGDILDQVSRLWDVLDDYREVVDGLSATTDSLITNRTNDIIKVLTFLSVLLLPLTLIASFYGMNVPLPFENQGYAILIIIGIMALSVLGLLAYFRAKRWL